MESSQGPKKLSEKISDTVTELFKQPGQVIDSFVEGSRSNYLNPILYVALAALVLAFVTSFVVTYPEMEVTPADPEQIEEMTEEMEGFRVEEFQGVMEVTGLIMNTRFIQHSIKTCQVQYTRVPPNRKVQSRNGPDRPG